ncbi:ATP-dependent helicase [Streptomyces sp. NPDC002952]|uniref:ATP-dependent helicase n=1 Tax=Streptomyces sp. NPDC002952 TaxID=3364673 RepID=UPI0036B23534
MQNGISSNLAAEIEELNEDQRRSVLQDGDMVVRAGPGSGKTRTLVARVGYLLETQISRYRGVAAITYTRSAAREITERLERFGITPGRRLTASTVHSWCLRSILQPYGKLAGLPDPEQEFLIDNKTHDWTQLLQQCFDYAGVMEDPKYEKAAVTRLRRRIAAGLEVNMSDPMARAAAEVDEELIRRGWIDFDAMVARSLRLIRSQPQIGKLVVSRYPHLVIDEYQDLGPVLHEIVKTLRDEHGAVVSAFGDADQTVMGFTGADPRFLDELSMTEGFETIPLRLNYRSGQAIVAASHAVLMEERPYEANPTRTDHGIIEPVAINGGLGTHAHVTAQYVSKLISQGVPPHEIVVIYPGKGYLLDCLLQSFHGSSIEFVHEADDSMPEDETIDFIKACAARTVAGFQTSSLESSIAQNVRTLRELKLSYEALRKQSALEPLRGRQADEAIAEVCARHFDDTSGEFVSWMLDLISRLQLDEIAQGSKRINSLKKLASFVELCLDKRLKVGDVTSDAIRVGKVSLSTYHKAKGREWEVVLLPGLIEGIMPGRRYNGRTRSYPPTPPDRLAQDRRSFYVGLTRAKTSIVMLYGEYFDNRGNYINRFGVSRFALDILNHLQLDAQRPQ